VIENTLKSREETHGSFKSQAEIAQKLKEAVRDGLNKRYLRRYQLESIDMICGKLARICAGDPDFADHWHDIAGYALLVEKELHVSHETKKS
jgi:hypothetical protein